MSEIEDLREQIAALQAKLRPLLKLQKAQLAAEVRERVAARRERRDARISQMMAWHDEGLSYRQIAQEIGLSRDYVAQLVQSQKYRRRMTALRRLREGERPSP